ncbi:MAG: hypothetical protein HY810_04930 [Candidatus Omnitrophica bacterium]|nr:hypothetical protein [Candidatus Omnitrophota bacterium]
MKKTEVFLTAVFLLSISGCNASNIKNINIKETNDFTVKYTLDNENFVIFTSGAFRSYEKNNQDNEDGELEELITEAVVKQKNHPSFDPVYAINPLDFKKRVLADYESYYRFPENHCKYQKKIPPEDLDKMINESKSKEFFESKSKKLESGNFKKLIIEKLKIKYLLDELNKKPAEVICVNIADKQNYTEKKLLVKDRNVGCFEVLMLQPKQKNLKYPAIICFHGHGQSNKDFPPQYLVEDLIREGFVLIIASFRAMGLTEAEYLISKKLLLNGFTLMGLGFMKLCGWNNI